MALAAACSGTPLPDADRERIRSQGHGDEPIVVTGGEVRDDGGATGAVEGGAGRATGSTTGSTSGGTTGGTTGAGTTTGADPGECAFLNGGTVCTPNPFRCRYPNGTDKAATYKACTRDIGGGVCRTFYEASDGSTFDCTGTSFGGANCVSAFAAAVQWCSRQP